MEGIQRMSEFKDLVEWNFNSDVEFSVASCYAFYATSHIPFDLPKMFYEAIELVWKSNVPFKIKTFGWRLLFNRLLTKDLLVFRGIPFPLDNLKCIFYGIDLEDCYHSFFNCNVVKLIWREIEFWVGKPDREEECNTQIIKFNYLIYYLLFLCDHINHTELSMISCDV